MPEYIYGHRGARAHLPENTLQAFQRAIDDGANAIETDVHITSDGHVVVFHDATEQRIAGTSAAIAQVTLKQALTWDVGYQYVDTDGKRPFAGNDYRMPLLSGLLEAQNDIRINIDIKPGTKAVRSVVDVVRRHANPSNVLLTGFDDGVREALHDYGYEGPVGLGRGEAIRALAIPRQLLRKRWAPGTRIQVPPGFGPFKLGSKRFISKAHAVGLKVDFWTINDPDEAVALVAYGADGIMSDDPALIASALR